MIWEKMHGIIQTFSSLYLGSSNDKLKQYKY